MSAGFLLHGPATGMIHWEFVAFGCQARSGYSDVAVDVATHNGGAETFTRKTGQHTFTTRLAQAEDQSLVETIGPARFVFDFENGPQATLRQRQSQVFGLTVPRFILDVSATIETDAERGAEVRSNVEITVLSILQFRYAATLTEERSS